MNRRPTADAPARLRVGLVNNMPDAAVAATERQFRRLFEAAAPGHAIEMVRLAIAGVDRSAQMRAHVKAHYRTPTRAELARLDVLVVTGANLSFGPLMNTRLWPALSRLVQEASELGVPALWSCLAAHAAVEHLHQIARTPLPEKRFGLFTSIPAGPHPLLEGVLASVIPHSRFHDLPESLLLAHGYEVLTRSEEAGVDAFVGRGPNRFLFLQGHPEYDLETLVLEYLRDLRRFQLGVRKDRPALPANLFSPESARRWRDADADADADLAGLLSGLQAGQQRPPWSDVSKTLIGNWLKQVVTAAVHTPPASDLRRGA